MIKSGHILFFEDKPTRFAGGQERSLFEMAERYHKQGLKVSLAYKEEGDFLPDYQAFCETTFKLESRQLRIRSLKKHLQELSLLKELDNNYSFTHFYANQYFDIPFVSLASMLFNKQSYCHLRLPAPPYLSRQYRFFLEKTDQLITISHHSKQTYEAVGLKNSAFSVVYNLVPKPNHIPPRKTPNGITTITYAGRICPEKGSELLIKAFAKVYQQNKHTELRFYGNVRGENTPENYIEILKELGLKLGIDKAIHFFPHQADFAPIAEQTDVFVLPSLWEAFGRLIVEAHQFGIPCVATNVGGIPEVMKLVGMQDLICEPNVVELKNALLKCTMQKFN